MRSTLFLVSLILAVPGILRAENRDYDVVVYGGTSAGITSAVQAKKMGKSVIVVSPDVHLGGLSSGGLGFSDTGDKAVIGGLAREFYHRVWREYQSDEAWKWQARSSFGNQGQGTPAIDGDARTMWVFEPSVAEKVFEDFVREYEIPVDRDEWLDRENGVEKEGAQIRSITTLSGKTYRGKIFIDATYEGDLMAATGVDYHVGRESREVYGEQWAGVQTGMFYHRHNFAVLPEGISPYVVPGDPSSGVLPRITTEDPGANGTGDDKVQAYCFRVCLTNHPENRIPFPKPEGYDPSQYELLLRVFDAGWREMFWKFDFLPNRKTDTNNHGPFSSDNIGMNYNYPEASYERRKEIIAEHEQYQKGLYYFMANDPRVPEDVRSRMQNWGLAADEFTDNGNWPHQLYVREARRMIGDFVMTENELMKRRPTPASIGMGSYTIDSHNVQRYITPEGHVQNEGDVGVRLADPYEIAYGALTPKRQQAENLLVPVAVSSSHIAFGSIRMEPVFMILGQSAATAAAMAIDSEIPVQEVPYEQLRERLLADDQVLTVEKVRVMSFNLWVGGDGGGQPLEKSAEAIKAARADIVGFQETLGNPVDGVRPDNGAKLAEMLGFDYFAQPAARGIASRFPITGQTPDGHGVQIELPSGDRIWVFNVHFSHAPYQPYQLVKIPYEGGVFLDTAEEAVQAAIEARGHQVRSVLEEMQPALAAGDTVFLTGDFNEPSHQDWTERAAEAGLVPLAVEWPTTKAVVDAGLTDSFRAVFPDEQEKRGLTWTPITTEEDPNDLHDRIDFVFFTGSVEIRSAEIVGEKPDRADIVIDDYPTDHRGVVSEFRFLR